MSEATQLSHELDVLSMPEGHASIEVLKALQHYEVSRGSLVNYILAAQPEYKLESLRYSVEEREGIRNSSREHLYVRARNAYVDYKSELAIQDKIKPHSFSEVFEEAAGRVFEDVLARFPEHYYEPWNVPRLSAPPNFGELQPETQARVSGFFEDGTKNAANNISEAITVRGLSRQNQAQ